MANLSIGIKEITYLFGAGASCEIKYPSLPEIDNTKKVHILPLAHEFNQEFERFASDIKQWKNHSETELTDLIINCQKAVIKHSKAAQKHVTIDTYARKLFLTKDHESLRELKILLDIFLIYIQIKNGVDKRYDAFFATLLEGGGDEKISLPQIINIITWNYDFQIEMALATYFNKNYLNKFEEGRNHWQFFAKKDYIFKINGSAMRSNFTGEGVPRMPYVEIDLYGDDLDTEGLKKIQEKLLLRYKSFTETLDIDPTISFAWEKVDATQFQDKIKNKFENTKILVVIGYSFPTFNRKIDVDLLAHMPNLEKIIIQSPDEKSLNSIKNRLLALYRKALLKANPGGFPEPEMLEKKIKNTPIEEKIGVDEFFIPFDIT